MYRIELDTLRRAVIVHIEGFWTLSDVAVFGADLVATVRKAALGRDPFDVIIESLDFPVQANDVADRLTGVMAEGIGRVSGHVAVVVGSYLNKLQAERTLVHPKVKVFQQMDDAERWLAAMRA